MKTNSIKITFTHFFYTFHGVVPLKEGCPSCTGHTWAELCPQGTVGGGMLVVTCFCPHKVLPPLCVSFISALLLFKPVETALNEGKFPSSPTLPTSKPHALNSSFAVSAIFQPHHCVPSVHHLQATTMPGRVQPDTVVLLFLPCIFSLTFLRSILSFFPFHSF